MSDIADMKDVTSTSFGLLIAFLLPGLAGLYSMTFWSARVADLFNAFQTAQSSVGLFLLVFLAALTLGLLLTTVRWVLFEVLICRKVRLPDEDFAELASDSKLTAFRAAVDEHYRYHQFWGGMTLVMPSLYFGLMGQVLRTANHLVFILLLLGFTGIEILTGWAAVVAYRNYVRRARHIMKRSARAERSHHGFE